MIPVPRMLQEKDTKTIPGKFNRAATTKLVEKATGRVLLEVISGRVPRAVLFRQWSQQINAAAELAAIAKMS